uniref:Uncharacterized protein n=1 Tax=Favella ehrenbergii TaxID=182087 RepID=A0A7S3MP53_9SPIT
MSRRGSWRGQQRSLRVSRPSDSGNGALGRAEAIEIDLPTTWRVIIQVTKHVAVGISVGVTAPPPLESGGASELLTAGEFKRERLVEGHVFFVALYFRVPVGVLHSAEGVE